VYGAFHAVYACPVPTIAAVDGPAVGAGTNLALAADVRIVSPKARLDSRFLAIPVHPGGGHFWMLARAGSAQTTAAMTLLGQALDGESAVRHGLALECVPAELLLDRARELCARAAATPRALLLRAKATWRAEASEPDLATASEEELREQLASMQTDAYRRAMGRAR
jgi:enoyl-CoA hydratase